MIKESLFLRTRLLAPLLFTLVVGCGTSADVMRIDPTPRPAKATWQEVVALFEEPEREFTRIAIIQADDDGNGLSFDDVRERIQKEAAKLGADAVIIGMPSTGSSGAVIVPAGEISVAVPVEVKSLTGVAIVWGDGSGNG